ncbi:type II CRISPR RNA-guided endonuclease Cas9 [Streptococcus castoreus]|uniref:type II CRISPR RNA-guided endonuclease Cas9 n=1 Tax=Streptococcus castoreus TaxID=254786 RepID=UPI0004097DB0|nr:type II CRISPR RNA-guided endonuclease Cas9 [Streptococcus castoreus]
MSKRKPYSIGLDIGTHSVGFSIIDENYKVITKKMRVMGNTSHQYSKKPILGALLFSEGTTSEDRRLNRTTRRRYNRRHQRLLYLQEIFEDEMNLVDENFFHRLSESFLKAEDKEFTKYSIFGTLSEEKEFYKKYPTIYHLRRDLADNTKRADLRVVYLALAHILKSRGHFLQEGTINLENIGVEEKFQEFLELYNSIFGQEIVVNSQVIEKILTGLNSKSRKVDLILAEIPSEKSTGKLAQFLKIIVGNQGDFKKVYELEEKLTLQFSKDTYEEDLEKLIEVIDDDNQQHLFDLAKAVYDAVLLSAILTVKDNTTKAPLSASMVQRYQNHKDDLRDLKAFFKTHIPDQFDTMFKDKSQKGYAGYVEGLHKKDKLGKFIQTSKPVSQEEFYKFTKTLIGNIPEGKVFLEKINQEVFLLKQRTFENGAIPHQVHLQEMRAILRRQGQFYPFLLDNQKKIERILTFRIPYYVGPLARGNSEFAWIKRNSDDKIRPWNFENLVDLSASATAFIDRMTVNDTYLPTEKVLPRHSLLYEQFLIFNELTKVKYIAEDMHHSEFLTGSQKKEIFNTLFKKDRHVSAKSLKHFLEKADGYENVEISGIDEKFNASYATYHDLKKKIFSKDFLDNEDNQVMLENISHTLTIFEDRKMIEKQLSRYSGILSAKQISELSRKKYTGWGRFSEKLINGIKDKRTGKSILDFLKDDGFTNRNFMQLINDDGLDFKEVIKNSQLFKDVTTYQSMVNDIAGSPKIKKGILQSLNIVDELVKVMGYNPSQIVVEMARENQGTNQGRHRSRQRLKKIVEGLDNLNSDLLTKSPIKDNSDLQKEKLLLYYLQDGKDMYTGTPLDCNPESLATYDVDHIIPQSFLKDNSIDNKVLTSSKENRKKLDDVPSQEVVGKRYSWWLQLKKAGLISERKFAYLTKGALTEQDKVGFINRQLVETRQITKHVARILDEKFNVNDKGERSQKVDIITLKSVFANRFRSEFKLRKIRELNDCHHAHDAYLNAVVAKAVLTVYPKLKRELVYGDYYHESIFDKKHLSATDRLNMYHNILKFFTKDYKIESKTGEILWKKEDVVKIVEEVIYQTPVTIVRKTETNHGALFKASNKAVGYNNNLIPRKTKGIYLDVTKYGGFIEPSEAYAVAILTRGIKGKMKNKPQWLLRGISLLERKEFEQNQIAFLEENGYTNIKKVIKLPKYSLFEFQNGRRRYLASSGELQKGNQITLPKHLIELLYQLQRLGNIIENQASDYCIEEHQEAFEELLAIFEFYNREYIQADNNFAKIKSLYEKNKNADATSLSESFINLLNFTQMKAATEFHFFGTKIDRRRYTSPNEVFSATLIYQSITGLYETRIDLSQLGEELWDGER